MNDDRYELESVSTAQTVADEAADDRSGARRGRAGVVANPAARTESEGPPRRALTGAYVVALMQCVVAAALVATLPGPTSSAFPAPLWIVAPIAFGYFVAERYLFNLDFRRDTISFSLSEVPTVFALAFLGPLVAIPVRVVSSVTAILISPRPPPGFKVVFNTTLFAFEAALAFTIVRAVAPIGEDDVGRFLVAAAAAVAVATLIGLVIVCFVISLFEGELLVRIREAGGSTLLTSATGALVAGLAVAPALVDLRLAPLPLLPIAGVWFVLRQHGSLMQDHRDLADLHSFAGAVDSSLQLDVIGSRAVEEIGDLLSADRVTLRLCARHFVDDDSVDPRADAGEEPQMRWHLGEPIEIPVAGDEITPTTIVPLGATGSAEFHPDDTSTGFAVPVVDGDVVLGMMAVAAPTGRQVVFGERAVGRAVDLAGQLATVVRNGLLHASVEHAALHDALTGEGNRKAFEDELDAALQESGAGALAVLVLDLNQFKEVNDTLGHHVGDQVLVEFSRRLRTILRPDDVLARLGGDEFAILVRRADKDEIRELADRILVMSYTPLSLDACDAVVTSSIGVSFVVEHDSDRTVVLRRADIAMYTAKNQRSGVEVYREEIDRRTPARLALLGDLRSGIERGELEVHYQPKVDLRTSTVVGAEALVRWFHPDRGWVRPDEFIGVAEESGLIRLVTDVVLDLAIRQAATWRRAGLDLDISVNLSALDLHGEGLAARVDELLREHELGPEHLVLEITESALMTETARTLTTIDELDRLGVHLALDDFGTGYSSLTYLRRLPVAELKIDRSFVSDLLLNSSDDVIVRSTIDLGHNLGLRVVAEGVENAQVCEHLAQLGCDIGQGYGLARPLAPAMFERWLDTTTHDVRRRQVLGRVVGRIS